MTPTTPPIEHVVVLVLENRSFDHLLGYLDHPDPAFDGLRTGGPYTNPGWDGDGPVAVSVLDRSTPRSVAEMPDLSAHVPAPGSRAAPQDMAATAPNDEIPGHYQPFVDLADNVARRLHTMGAADATGSSGALPLQRARRAVDAFRVASEQSRAAPPSRS